MDFNPDILSQYFKGNYSRKEYIEIQSIFSDLRKRSGLKNHLEKHWKEFSDEEMYWENSEQLLHKIHHQIHIEENSNRKFNLLSFFQKAAAILIIPLILSFFAIIYFQSNSDKKTKNEVIINSIAYAEIQCPMGVRTKFELPDGTTGFLNSGSRLRYPVNFVGGRDVTLSGEAFFNVFHNEAHPFTVQTRNLEIKDLGTQFNVIAYEDESEEEIILNEGKVEVDTKEGQPLGELTPNNKLVLDTKKGTFKKEEVEAYQYIGWTDGKLILRNENILQVAKRLGRWYNVDIEVHDKELYNYAFRATFIDEPLEEVLKLLALTAPFTYQEVPRSTTSDNIYRKRKILVKLDKNRLRGF